MIYNFSGDGNDLSRIDSIPDFRSEVEKESTPLQIYDHDRPDIAYAERMAEELVNISGAWVRIHRVVNNEADDVWGEDAEPLYEAGVELKAFFKPQPLEIELTEWGADIKNKTEIVFSRANLLKKYGPSGIKIGDVIYIPHNSMMIPQGYYRITNATDSGNFHYRWLYITAEVENITGDITIKPEFI